MSRRSMGRNKTDRIDILYVRIQPKNKAKLLRFVEGMKRAGKKGASVSAVVDRLIEENVYDRRRKD